MNRDTMFTTANKAGYATDQEQKMGRSLERIWIRFTT
jgi:hypothetical protein